VTFPRQVSGFACRSIVHIGANGLNDVRGFIA